jgi:hypothetical protein
MTRARGIRPEKEPAVGDYLAVSGAGSKLDDSKWTFGPTDSRCQWILPSLPAMDNSFDFFVGTWTSRQRRLRQVLAGCEDWYEFPGTTRCWSVLDGAGNFDEVTFPTLGFSGVTLRLYDKDRDEWSLYWASSRTGMSLPPVVGRFGAGGRGVFTAEEEYEGAPIVVRFLWSEITATSCRWEQAFSTDGGATWETNWIADFSRTGNDRE